MINLKKLINMALCLLVIVIAYMLFYCFQHNIDYWKTIGVGSSGLYNDIVSFKGVPANIEYTDDGGVYVCYDGLKFYYTHSDLRGAFLRAEVIDDSYFFGHKHIAVGDKKEKLVDFYKYSKELSDVSENEKAYFFADGIVHFIFDENDVVNKIVLAHEL